MDQGVAGAASLSLEGTFSGTVDWAVVGVEILPGGGGLALAPAGGKALLSLANTTRLKRVQNTLTKAPAGVAALASPPAGTVWRSYYYSGGTRVAMQVQGETDQEKNGVFYILSDHLGSTNKVARGDGSPYSELRYKAWGEKYYPVTTRDLYPRAKATLQLPIMVNFPQPV